MMMTDDLEALVQDFQRDYTAANEEQEWPIDLLLADLDTSTAALDPCDVDEAHKISWDVPEPSEPDDLNFPFDWDAVESLVTPADDFLMALPDEEDDVDDSDGLTEHPMFLRLTTAIRACQSIGSVFNVQGLSSGSPHGARALWQQHSLDDSCAVDLDDFMDAYCSLFESMHATLLEFDARLHLQIKIYQSDIANSLLSTHAQDVTFQPSLELEPPDKSELRQRHPDSIKELSRKILQKRKKSRLSDHAVAVLKMWWDGNAANPYPSEAVKAALGEQANLTMLQVNNWFINRRKRSKPQAA